LITLEDIELDILDACGDKSTVDSFREILDVIGFEKYSVNQLDLILSSLEPLLPIAGEFDLIDKDTWPRWATTVSTVRPIFHELFSLLPPENRTCRPISIEDISLISALSANMGNPLSGFVPVKAVLLIGCYRHYLYKKYEHTELERPYNYADIGGLKSSITGSARYPSYYKSISEKCLPEWPTSSPALWKQSFLEKTSGTPTTNDYKFIHTIRQILALKLENDVASPTSQREHFLPIHPTSSRSPSTARSISPESQFADIQNVSPSNASASEASVVTPVDRSDKNGQEKPLFSLREIVKTIRGKNPSAAEKAIVGIFREILEVLSFGNCPVDQLDIALKSVEELLPITTILSPRYSEVWSRWSATILVVRDVLRKSFPGASSNQWRGKSGEYPLISCLVTEINGKAHSGLLPAKAIVLIRFYAMRMENPGEFSFRGLSYVVNPENNLADTIRKCCTLKWMHLAIAQEYLPVWPGASSSEWIEAFEKKAIVAPTQIQKYGRPRSDKYDFIHTIQDTLLYVAKIRIDLPTHEPVNPVTPLTERAPFLLPNSISSVAGHLFSKVDDIETRILADTAVTEASAVSNAPINSDVSQHPYAHPAQPIPSHFTLHKKQNSSVLIHPPRDKYSRLSSRKLPVRPSFDLFQEEKSNVDGNTEALPPDIARVIPQPDTPADQPSQPVSVQMLEVRYSNYRTAMDNQRLPWAWDCLNDFEIASLTSALKESASLENAPAPERKAAFLVWLMLATGQSIEGILRLDIAHAVSGSGALLLGPIYRRRIHSPLHAFRPAEDQNYLLSSHADYINLPLLPPFPSIFNELGLCNTNITLFKQHSNVGASLNLTELGAYEIVRQFLEQHRTRVMRLLPGRIRNVLSTVIMQITSDPVVTHLLSSLPSDMPPSGVYYTSYEEDVLRRIYLDAVTRIFGKEHDRS
jgi:hypothetical protein